MKPLPIPHSSSSALATSESSRTERLEHENEQLRRMLDLAPGSIIVHDQEGRILYANRFASNHHGYPHDEFLLLRIHDILAADQAIAAPAKIAAIFDGGEPVSFESVHARKDGGTFPMLVNIRETRWNGKRVLLSVSNDLSEQKKTERAIMRAEKLESLGILAGGIAHDFNNLLNGVFGYIDLARGSATDVKTRTSLEKAFSVFDRAKELAMQLLTYSKGGAPSLHPVDIAQLLATAAGAMLTGTSVKPRMEIAATLAQCNGDQYQLSQVFAYILRNVLDALPGGGECVICAVDLPAGSDPRAPSQTRAYVRIIITDNGAGIAPEHLSHVFDPFYTTKPRANGLGLTTAYMIVKRHRGLVTIESKPGTGTNVIVYLPARPQSAV